PLSDATLDNGCIYLIPRDLIAAETAEAFIRTQTVGFAELAELLQGSRALPARAGSVLGRDYPLIHWGAKRALPRDTRAVVAAALRFGFFRARYLHLRKALSRSAGRS